MLWGLVEPRLFVRMSRTPAHSSPARTAPPPTTPPPRPPRRCRPAALRHALRPPRAPSPAHPSSPARTGPPGPTAPPGLSARAGVRSPLELQSAFAGAVGHGFHAPVILVAAAVEHDL